MSRTKTFLAAVRAVSLYSVLVLPACGGGGGGGGTTIVVPTAPPPPAPEPVSNPQCEPAPPQLRAVVRPESSHCNERNTVLFELTNGSCTQDLLIERARIELVDSSSNECGDFEFDPIEINRAVPPQGSFSLEESLPWCCRDCSAERRCSWKVEVRLHTEAQVLKVTSNRFTKVFDKNCRNCSTGTSSGQDRAPAPAPCSEVPSLELRPGN